jgi:hypothetical protein
MKKIQCQHCEEEFSAETREEMLSVLYNHYIKDHNEIITTVDDAGKKKWMEAFEVRWSTAQETT